MMDARPPAWGRESRSGGSIVQVPGKDVVTRTLALLPEASPVPALAKARRAGLGFAVYVSAVFVAVNAGNALPGALAAWSSHATPTAPATGNELLGAGAVWTTLAALALGILRLTVGAGVLSAPLSPLRATARVRAHQHRHRAARARGRPDCRPTSRPGALRRPEQQQRRAAVGVVPLRRLGRLQ